MRGVRQIGLWQVNEFNVTAKHLSASAHVRSFERDAKCLKLRTF